MKKYLYLFLFFSIINSCREEQIPTYSGGNYVYFEKEDTKLPLWAKKYSFVYLKSDVKIDTIYARLRVSGPTVGYDRNVRFKQELKYRLQHIYDENGAVDSMLVLEPNQAVPGVHYVSFEDETMKDRMVVKKDSAFADIPIVLIRDISLREADRSLLFRIVPTEDLLPGDVKSIKGSITISDILTVPAGWEKNPINPGVKNEYFGEYGRVKHQLLIDATGLVWDDKTMARCNEDFDFAMTCKRKAVKMLDEINAERASNSLPPLRENPNDARTNVVFP